MTSRKIDFAKDAFAFVEAIENADTPEALLGEMHRALGVFGFENFVITSLPRPGQSMRKAILIHHLPDQWFELYTRKSYADHDPVIRHCRQTVKPFEWGEAPFDADSDPGAVEVMRRARDYRMEQGFCVPIHGINGYDACISLSGKEVDLSPRTKPAIHLMALYAFDRGRQISGGTLPDTLLSPREREVLAHSAQGLSAPAIAQRLGITERTVTAHVANACQKLDAANKTQAVARALHYRYISL
ncbi:helix-turn-helix transcriptional regulator [Salinarimonas ramus]|uniref:Transcriptional activator protein BjaR1 n=1 Tax=Salinarimonas ramus TaxID=690164 RepID=A0A917Q9T2_9HYPH|nr:LuxR family transcriptional regulator [Salinarimonas ramus]GGK36775.1 transcriptional activator protein BjaR1 [Salinarimonas ramus]